MHINEVSRHIIQPYEKSMYQAGDEQHIIDFLNSNCKQALTSSINLPLFRGSRGTNTNMLILDPSKGIRKSISLGNQYTLLMDNSPYFKNYPKRANSLICTTSQATANDYGKTFLVFPVDNTVIGVCPESDIWESTIDAKYLAHQPIFYSDLNRCLLTLGVPDSSFEEMKKYVSSKQFLARYTKYIEDRKNSGRDVYMLPEPYMLLEKLQYDMRPEVSEFKLTNIKKISSLPDMNRKECWFSSPCVLVEVDTYWSHIDKHVEKNYEN